MTDQVDLCQHIIGCDLIKCVKNIMPLFYISQINIKWINCGENIDQFKNNITLREAADQKGGFAVALLNANSRK